MNDYAVERPALRVWQCTPHLVEILIGNLLSPGYVSGVLVPGTAYNRFAHPGLAMPENITTP
jgi:hypothetical protein